MQAQNYFQNGINTPYSYRFSEHTGMNQWVLENHGIKEKNFISLKNMCISDTL